MKNIVKWLIYTAVLISLVACAGSPPPAQSGNTEAEDESSAVESVTQEPEEAVWKVELEVVMAADGTVDKTIMYEYDNQGNLLRIIESDDRDELLYLREFFYEDDNLIRQDMSDRYGLVSSTTYENNADGKPVRETKYDAEDEPLSVVTYRYRNGLVEESVAGDGSGTPHLSARYSYEGDAVVLVEYFLPGGREEARFERVLENGKPVEEKTLLPDGSVETSVSFEYESGRLAGARYFTGTSLAKTVRYDYDEAGNIIRETWLNRQGREYEVLERRWIQIDLEGQKK